MTMGTGTAIAPPIGPAVGLKVGFAVGVARVVSPPGGLLTPVKGTAAPVWLAGPGWIGLAGIARAGMGRAGMARPA